MRAYMSYLGNRACLVLEREGGAMHGMYVGGCPLFSKGKRPSSQQVSQVEGKGGSTISHRHGTTLRGAVGPIKLFCDLHEQVKGLCSVEDSFLAHLYKSSLVWTMKYAKGLYAKSGKGPGKDLPFS
jgi:hypothetical protein